ncbi:protein tramtrack, beta isoform isoform X6 [Eurytemora carolleeae]|uniref:protein tramtrack, beta isoform isoform X6 n=1 Tax=Eurytemora carolleeae TaxID=1294199 RepID=UPI000C75B856|nr:protein tramtrack, beta isoform isoform X6 [Eurytemora carolleeae]|eukprot:XP_023339227.1 protein tramtrack, beta isoform-like isoform X6 [Eurytemora affinis]
MGTEKFCLKWNDFESNISLAFREIRDEKDFFDVTLACDDDQLQAHKVILSACSPFFRNILKRNPHQHPLLYLKGVKYSDLQSVLNFMYHGEVNVAQDELNSFLAVAEELRVKGLTQNNGSQSAKGREPVSKSPPPIKSNARPSERDSGPPPKRPRPTPPTQITPPDDDDIQEVVPVKSEPRDSSAVISTPGDMYQPSSNQQSLALTEEDDYGQDESYDDYGQYGDGSYDGQMMDPSMAGGADGNKGGLSCAVENELVAEIERLMFKGPDRFWNCKICAKTSKLKTDISRHVEAVHMLNHPGITCDICGEISKTRNAHRQHRTAKHTVHRSTMEALPAPYF